MISKSTQLDDILNRAAEKLQLDDTRKERMETAYKAVAEYLEGDDFFKNAGITIYPQGSVRIGTTVKPEHDEEFDLDTVVHLEKGLIEMSPFTLYDKIKHRLDAHEYYKTILDPKNRVLRLNYKGDFHMDIMPGCQEFEYDEDRIRIPDKERKKWMPSNPKGYAKWFESKYIDTKNILLEKAFAATELPKEVNYRFKQPIQRAVQLLKKYRELFLERNPRYIDFKTSSIIITTIAGNLYNGEDSIFETIENIVSRVRGGYFYINRRIEVRNPVNNDEIFTDKWDENRPMYEEAFRKYIESVYSTWIELKNGLTTGFLNEQELQKAFGAKAINAALNEQKGYFEKSYIGTLPLLGKKDEYSSLHRMAAKSNPWSI